MHAAGTTLAALFLLVAWLGQTGHAQQNQAAAQSFECICPDLELIKFIDQEIATLVAKRAQVAAGLVEAKSGLPNDLTALDAQLRKLWATRFIAVRDYSHCRRTCIKSAKFDPKSPNFAYSGAKALCPECTERARALGALETKLAALLKEMEQFRQNNRIRSFGGETTADFEDRVASADRARAIYELRKTRYKELVNRAEELSKKGIGDGTDSNAITFFVGEFAEGFAALGELFIVELRNEGVPIPEEVAISRWGKAEAAKKLAKRYFNESVEPALEAYQKILNRLPDLDEYLTADADKNGRYRFNFGSTLNQLARYERELERLLERRSRALDLLIACNVKMCLPKPDMSGLFEPGGAFEGHRPASETKEESTEAEPDNGEGLTGEGPMLDNPDPAPLLGQQAGAAQPGDQPAATPAPQAPTGLALPENFNFEVPNGTTIKVPEIPPEVLAALQAASGQVPQVAGICDFDPVALCRRLNPAFTGICTQQLSETKRLCLDYQRRAFVEWGRQQSCEISCVRGAASVAVEFNIRDWALETIEMAKLAEDREVDEKLDALMQERAENLSEIAVLSGLPETRPVQIYRNTNSGELVLHAGSFFQPAPPLIFVGSMPGTLSDEEQEKLYQLQRKGDQIDILIELLEQDNSNEELLQWYRNSRRFWNGGDASPNPLPCRREEIGSLRAQCEAECRNMGESAGPRSICQPSSIIGYLGMQRVRDRLYPPGSGERNGP